MGSLAGLLKARGLRVTGSDRALYPPMSTALADGGIPVTEGFDPQNVLAQPPDLVVIGNAVRPDNAEAQAALNAGLPVRSFPDALYELAIAEKHCLAVCGTHGKTTTTSLCAFILEATGRRPSFLIGGIAENFGASFGEGQGEHFVVEGDEYDTAFFDKTPKFLHYHPETAIVTSVEFDHADIYRDLDHVKSAFRQLVAEMPEDGTLVVAGRHSGVRAILSDARCRVVEYGIEGEKSDRLPLDREAVDISVTERGTRFTVRTAEGSEYPAEIPLFGRFNVENALAALSACESLGVGLEESIAVLTEFKGVKRRQEIRGRVRGVTVMDDFAHHPTAVKGAIQSVRSRFPKGRLIAVFEPRTNTSRRRIFQEQYEEALVGADRVLVFRVAEEPIYSATGEVTELFSADELVTRLRGRDVDASALSEVQEIVDTLSREAQDGDTILVMSNGAFGNIWERVLAAL
ncbi:MAG: hypothetical protein CBC48_00705 [bacterium TMED88]|nr:MAG: hypothetical protein CBC48_00705 [bacterium TMED88]